jgi:putative ABC transporter-associated repeat protein
VPNLSNTDSGATILNDGHVDIASLIDGRRLVTKVKDTTVSNVSVWRDLDESVLQLLPGSRTAVPDNPAYAFLGAPGSTIWQVSQTQQSGLLWPGWSTEAIPVDATTAGIGWSIDRVQGPGEFALYQTSQFGTPTVLFNTRDGLPDRYEIPKNVHAHGSWAFTAEGTYCLAFARSATLADGTPVTDKTVLAVAVGTSPVTTVDPAECFAEASGRPATPDHTPIPDAELTPDTKGGVTVQNGDGGLLAGQQLTVQAGRAHAGEWISPWLHPTPRWLDWVQLDAAGKAQLRLPGNTAVGTHRLVLKSRAGALIGWDALTVVAPPAPPAPDPTPPAPTPEEQQVSPSAQVAATQCVAGATILSSGHIDYGSRIIGGELQSLVKDGTTQTTTWREPSGTVLWLKPSSAVALTPPYSAIGPAGSTVWQVPQTQNPALIWLGWNTEELGAGVASGTVSWSLDAISGPGSVKVYLQGAFGGVQEMVFDNGGRHEIELGRHVHGNWAFSAEGIYRLTFTQTATLPDARRSSDTETLTLAVGDVDPAAAVSGATGCGAIADAVIVDDEEAAAAAAAAAQAAAEAAAAAAAAESAKRTAREKPDTDADSDPEASVPVAAGDSPVPLLLLTLGLLLILGAAGGGLVWYRSRTTPERGTTP